MIKFIKHTKAFKKDVKRYQNHPIKLKKLAELLRLLSAQDILDKKYKDHPLKGNYINRRECHIEGDFLLIYRTSEDTLYLERLGSHSDLFN